MAEARSKGPTLRRMLAWTYTLAFCAFALYFVLLPTAIIVAGLRDPAWRTGAMPRAVGEWHVPLARRIEAWAQARVQSGRAQTLDVQDVSGTEWPLLSAVLFLWTTESLQADWVLQGSQGPSPAQRSAAAIAALARLIADPAQAHWVRHRWGDDYLVEENLFYRMLLIAGLDSVERLSDDRSQHALLQSQVRTLAAELDASPYGVLEDYPGESYSVDVLLAYAAIARARDRLGIADPAWVERAQRAFGAGYLDQARQLPAYVVDAHDGTAWSPARGVGLSMMLMHAHQLWPALATQWYANYVQHYWQQRWGLAGFREFPADNAHRAEWMIEVDAGPVVAGFGTAANGFGLGAARVQGDMDRAYTLSALALVAAWPLPDGTLLGPRLVSNLIDAPLTGEVALLYSMSRTPASPPASSGQARTPAPVWIVLLLAAWLGIDSPRRRLRALIRTPAVAGNGLRTDPA